jgi:hypothetical protein
LHGPGAGLYNHGVNLPAIRALPFLALLPFCASARPLLPELPLGTGASSFGGGGTAHAAGLNAVFDNPAALSIEDDLQAEAGMMGMSGGISPYFLYGSRAGGKSSYALGYFYDARPGGPEEPVRPRQGLIAGVSWEADPHFSIGGAVRTVGIGAGAGQDGFGVDGDAGVLFRPWSALWAGAAVRNLQESGVGQSPEGFAVRRAYAASVGTGLESLHLPGLTFHEPDAYFELRSEDPFSARYTEAFSLASAFTPGGKLGLRGTLVLPHEGDIGFALGTFLNLPMGNGKLGFAYTFQSGSAEQTGETGASHSISINVRMGGKSDPFPPSLEVQADKALAEPAEPDAPAAVFFHLTASDKTYAGARVEGDPEKKPAPHGPWSSLKPEHEESRPVSAGRIQSWTLSIRTVGGDGVAGPEVKTYQGKDLPPRVIRWDAVDAAGNRLPPGFYSFRLDATDAAGNRSSTAWQLLEIGASAARLGN